MMLTLHAENTASMDSHIEALQGRDANRNLQRSLKAARLRERLPAAVQQLAGAATQWEDERGAPFTYDRRPLLDILNTMLEELQEEARQRVEHVKKQVYSIKGSANYMHVRPSCFLCGLVFSGEAEKG